MPIPLYRRLSRVLATLGLVLVTITAAPAAADEHETPVNLSLRPVDQPGAYFDLTMEPGDSRQLEATLGNNGLEAMEVRTYPADVFTMVNGGIGAEERDGEPSGTTTWVDYGAEVFALPGGEQVTRALSITVPENAEPGEYATSMVLENDVPIEGSGAVTLNQIVRQVLPVIVRVPGTLEPAFEFGEASHRFAGEQSTISVEIGNTGNARLAPAGDLAIRDDNGETVSEASVDMNTFFSNTETYVETVLDEPLDPGDYTLTGSMTDPETGVKATAEDLPFTVEGEPAEEIDTADEPGETTDNNILLWSLVAVVVILLLLVAFMMIKHHRDKKTSE